MKIYLKALTLVFVFVFAVFAQKQDETATTSFSKAPYRTGEKLTYSISFSHFTNAAYAELKIVGRAIYFDREGIAISANVQTNESILALFAINNDYTTYVSPENGKPYRTIITRRENNNPEEVSREYNEPAGSSAIPSRKVEYIGDYDFISALYRLRALPLTQGSSFRFTARYDATPYEVTLNVIEKKLVKTNIGSVNTIVTQLRVNNDKKADSYRIKIYFSDDENHIPVLITVQLRAGEIRAELASSELLKEETKPANPNPTKTPQSANTSPATTNPTITSTNPTITNSIPGINQTPINTDPNVPQRIDTTGVGNPPVNPANPTKTPTVAATPQPKPFPKEYPFEANEQLNFNIHWQNSQRPVGKVGFQISQRTLFNGKDSLELKAKVDSVLGAITKLFNLNDSLTTYVEPESLLPYRSETKLQQQNSKYNQTLTLDQNRGLAQNEKGQRAEIPVGTHDVLSLIYALRIFDLTLNKKTTVAVYIGNRAVILTVIPLRREVIELGGQSIKAVQLQITTDDPNTTADDNQGDKYNLRLWVSEDLRRLPLRFSAKLSDGTLRADLAIASTK